MTGSESRNGERSMTEQHIERIRRNTNRGGGLLTCGPDDFNEICRLAKLGLSSSRSERRDTPRKSYYGLVPQIVRRVCELPDRDSPPDQPEMLLVTTEELTNILNEMLGTNHESAKP